MPAWIHTEPCWHCKGPPESPWKRSDKTQKPVDWYCWWHVQNMARMASILASPATSNITTVGYYFNLACSFVLLPPTDHLVSDVCFWYWEVVASALVLSNDRNLNLLQWVKGWQGIWERECEIRIIFLLLHSFKRISLHWKYTWD